MRKFLLSLLTSLALLAFFPKSALAHCPLCVVGAGTGLGVSRFLGIDDSITGVWLAAVIGALALWTDIWVRGKNLKFLAGLSSSLTRPLIYLLFFVISLWSFYQFGLIDEHLGMIFGVPKLTFGLLTGAAVFYLVDEVDNWLIARRGKVFFPYQRIIVSLGAMLVLSLGIYILINYYI